MPAKNMRILKPIKKPIYDLTPANKKNIYKLLGVKNQKALLKTKFKHHHPVKKKIIETYNGKWLSHNTTTK